jgi:hypothetical protein
MEAAIMELTEEESAVGDTAVSTDPLEDGVPMWILWISPPTASSSSAVCVSTLFPTPRCGGRRGTNLGLGSGEESGEKTTPGNAS